MSKFPLLWSGWPLMVVLAGCAWRSQGVEHYFGPMLLRQQVGQERTRVLESAGGPWFFEGGTQWGLSLGLHRRLLALPPSKSAGSPRRTVYLPLGDGWYFSPFHTAVPTAQSGPRFVDRRLFGLQLGLGGEGNSLSLGFTSIQTLTAAPKGSHCFWYLDRHPGQTRFLYRVMPGDTCRPAKKDDEEDS